MLENRNPRYDLLAVLLLVIIAFLSSALLTYDRADPVGALFSPLDQFYQSDILVYPQNVHPKNACGYWGALTADVLFTTLGVGAYFLVTGLVAVAIALFQNQSTEILWSKTVGWFLTLVGITTLATMLFPEFSLGPIIGPGGYLGALGAGLLELHVARIGGLILAFSVLGIGLFLWTEYVLVRLLGSCLLGAVAFGSSLGMSRWAPWQLASRNGNARKVSADESELDESEEELEEDEEEESSFFDDYEEEGLEDEEEAEAEEDHEGALDDDDWDEEEDPEEQAKTIPFVVKTAAKTAALLRGKKKAPKQDEEQGEVSATDEKAPEKPRSRFGFGRKKSKEPATPTPPPAPVKPPSEREQVIHRLNQASAVEETADYDLPNLELLKASERISQDELRAQTMKRGRLLEQKFKEFGINIKVVDVETGPVITQYELQLEAGLRLAKIANLSDDIAIGLRVPSVRIVAPIPGKNTVGIEVPNETRQMVRLRDVIEQSSQKTKEMKIPLFLGQDVAGNTMVSDLSKLPHLLIAGRTGTGKSVCLNAIITSILMTRRPDEVRMLMIDPKMVELSGYGRLPHLMHPVVTDMRKAEAILAWAVEKMEDRYRLLARAGVRHINSYNQLGEEELMERLQPQTEEEREEIPLNLPFIVIVADEMADLMMTAGKEVEQHIIRLAQKSRAVGIHLILATQKPTVDVITGLIKSNLPARISFQVASQNDSRVVLDSNGAEKLLGNGDMLFLWPGTSTLLRGQGTFLGDDEIDAITDSVSTGEQNFVNELVNLKVNDDKAGDEAPAALDSRDELYQKAVEIVIRENRGSVSLLQRALSIGYGRAARLIDYMEEDGIVGPYMGSKSREIMMTVEQWHSACLDKAAPSAAPETPAEPPASKPAASLSPLVTHTNRSESKAKIAPPAATSSNALPKKPKSDPPETTLSIVSHDADSAESEVVDSAEYEEVEEDWSESEETSPDEQAPSSLYDEQVQDEEELDEADDDYGDEYEEDEDESDHELEDDEVYNEAYDEDEEYDDEDEELADEDETQSMMSDWESDEEEDEELEAEDDEDEEWEYEYVDEDGAPIDGPADGDEDEWEYEYVEEDE